MSIRFGAPLRALLALAPLAALVTAHEVAGSQVEAADTVEIEVAYHLRSSLGISSSLTGVTIAVGVGRETDDPLFIDRPVLRRVTSDAEGYARTTIELPRAMTMLDGARIWARIEAKGWARTVRSLPIANSSAEKPVVLRARPGRFMRGRVLTGSGAPVAGARVWLIDPKTGEGPAGLSDERGHFLVRYDKSGAYFLHARSAHPGQPHGTGGPGRIELDVERSHHPVDIHIQGRPAVTGRVIDPAGEPVRGAHVLALPRDLTAFPKPGTCMRAERDGNGLLGGHARTDGDGRFELPGLVEGDYDIYAALSWAWDDEFAVGGRQADGFHTESQWMGWDDFIYPESARALKLATTRIGQGDGNLELVLPVHRVEVKVTNPAGGSPDPYERSNDGSRNASRLSITRSTGVHWDPPRYPIDVDGLHVFHVPDAGDYAISWTELGVPYAEEPVTVGTWHTRLDLRLGQRSQPAKLTIRMLGPSGQLLPEDSQVAILSEASRRLVKTSVEAGYGAYSLVHDSQWSVDLPAGRFIVRATAETLMGCIVPDPYPRATRVPAERVVELQPGEDVKIDLQLGRAGFLDMVSLEAPSGLLPHEKKRYPIEENDPVDIRSQLGGGVAYLTGPGLETIGPLWFESKTCSWAEWEWTKPGWSSRCMTPLPPGSWTLEVRGDDGLLFQRAIVIEEGTATTVEW